MATQYTNLLGFALPTTGELAGTWGTVVNNSITELVEDSIAATATAAVTSGDWTLTTTGSGASNEARCAILVPTGSPGVSRNIIAPSQSKAYIVINQSNAAVVLKGSATTGTTIAAGDRAVCAWNGTDFVTIASSAVDGVATISFGSTGLTPSTATSGAVTVAGTLAVGNGGTGQTSAQAAINSLAGATTSGQYLRGNGTNVVMSAIQAGDVPTLNQNTTGTASNVTGTVAVANGGTGLTTLTANNVILGNGTSTPTFVAPGTNGNVLKSNGTTWTSAAEAAQVYPGAGIAVSTGSAWDTSKASPTGTIVGTSDTQTLTNKRIDPRVVAAGATSGNLTIAGDTTDVYKAEGLTGAITFLQPSGTPVDGQRLVIRIEDNGTARGITWTTTSGAFRAVGITLPTTTVLGKVTYVGCMYNSTDTFWDAIATVTQA